MKNPNLHALNARRMLFVDHGASHHMFRELHLAWCLLRGRTIDQIESKTSNPHHFPDPKSIANHCLTGYRPFDPLFYGVMTEAEYKAEKEAFHKKIMDGLTAWKKQLHLTGLTVEANRRKKNALKRSTLRIHPRPKPETLPHQKVA